MKSKQPELAGVIIELLIQGAGGMKFHSPAALGSIRQLSARPRAPQLTTVEHTGCCEVVIRMVKKEDGPHPMRCVIRVA